jgi:hypothetical protein
MYNIFVGKPEGKRPLGRPRYRWKDHIRIVATTSRSALEPAQPPIQWVVGVLSLGVKQPRQEDDHLLPFSVEAKNALIFTSTPLIHLHGVVLTLY